MAMRLMHKEQMTNGDKETLASLGLQRIRPGAGELDEVKKLKKDLEQKNQLYDEERDENLSLMFAMDL
jgi:hypothetical protein